ncbi:hypothetical protein QCA50_005922 [Cerrena zonata]|uniref:Uncharacterized protein n=1 Tax=Cerrena zonata TaxID=2478898 RepID=A0AAW0GD19_9APHY
MSYASMPTCIHTFPIPCVPISALHLFGPHRCLHLILHHLIFVSPIFVRILHHDQSSTRCLITRIATHSTKHKNILFLALRNISHYHLFPPLCLAFSKSSLSI